MKLSTVLVACALFVLCLSIATVSGSFLSEIVELSLSDGYSRSMKGGSGGSSGGKGSSSSSGGKSSNSGSSKSSSSSSSKSSSTSSKSTNTKSATTNGKTTSKSTKTTNSVPNAKVAAAYQQYAQSRLAGMKAVKGPNPAAAALNARFTAAFAAQPTVNSKLTANSIKASYQQQMAKNMVGKIQNFAKNLAATPIGKTITSKYQQFAKTYQAYQAQQPKIDKTFLGKLEGYSEVGKVPNAGVSGVTIGTGFDVGQQTVAGLKSLGISKDLVGKLSPYTGLQRAKAETKLKETPLSLTKAEVASLDNAIQSKLSASLISAYNTAAAKNPKAVQKFTDLPAAVQTVAYSVHHQYGDISKKTPNFFGHLVNNNYPGMVKELKNFKDDYDTRRKSEASYMGKALGLE